MNSLKTLMLATALLAAPAAAYAADQRTITVQGHGEAQGTPDQATVSAGVTTLARTAATALADNAAAMNRVFDALKRIGVQDKNIQTSNFSVEPQYAPYNSNVPAAQKITGYQVSNNVTVTLDHVSNAGAAIDALVSAGANQLGGISFGIKDPKPLLTTARQEAVDDAVARAQILTSAAHVSLGPIVSIQEESTEAPRPIAFMARSVAASAPTPVAAGQQTVSANVTITWAIQ